MTDLAPAIEAARQLHCSGMSAQHAAENVMVRFDLTQNEANRVAAAVERIAHIAVTRIGGIKLAEKAARFHASAVVAAYTGEPVPESTRDFRGCITEV